MKKDGESSSSSFSGAFTRNVGRTIRGCFLARAVVRRFKREEREERGGSTVDTTAGKYRGMPGGRRYRKSVLTPLYDTIIYVRRGRNITLSFVKDGARENTQAIFLSWLFLAHDDYMENNGI